MLTRKEKIFTLLGTLLGMLLAALDQTIVATAGPAIQADLHIAPSVYAWITTAYLVTSTMMVPVYGKLSDLYGRKRILVVGILVFLFGSFLCGIAPTSTQLILYRGVQGIGSAALFTSAFAVVADIFPPAERGKYQGIFGSAFGLSSVVGPLLGGFITDQFGWHWVFFINLPIGAIALALILSKMPPLRRHFGELRPSVDVPGALLLMLAVVPLLLALSLGRGRWASWPILSLFAVCAVGIATFLQAERRAKDPIIDLRLFRNRAFAVGNAAAFVVGSVFLGAIVFLPLFMVNVVGLSATRSGLTVTPLTMGVVAGNVLSGQLVSRLGRYKSLMVGSLLLLTVGFVVMGFTLSPDSTQAEVTLKMIVVGLGLGPSIPLFTLSVQNAVDPRQMGVATSSVTFFRSLGSTMGVALLGTVFGATLSTQMATRMPEVVRDVPPALRAQLSPGGPPGQAGGEGPGPVSGGFQAEELKAKVRARIQDPGLQAQAVSAVDRVERAFKASFTSAIERIYRVTTALALLGLLIVSFMPELPLRRTHHAPPPGAE
jgi:EmrB/QacA subfamily drug resistance transporter